MSVSGNEVDGTGAGYVSRDPRRIGRNGRVVVGMVAPRSAIEFARRVKSFVNLTDPVWRVWITSLYRRPRGTAPRRDAHVLLAPPGSGNIGDQALVGAYLDNVVGRVVIVVRNSSELTLADPRVEIVELPDLVYGRADRFARDYVRFMALLDEATDLSVIGADVMDGAYNYRASCARSLLARRGAERGIDTRILGFSWNSDPNRAAAKYLRKAMRSGVSAFLRDPQSLMRVKADGMASARPAADIVFARITVARPLREAPARPYAIVNVSGLISRTVDQAEAMSAVVERLLRAGRDVIVVPHVSHSGGDDVAAGRTALRKWSTDPRVSFIDELLSPDEVATLAAGADLAVTGRMHLSILAMLGETPSIVIATQGKVSGLLEMFDLDWCGIEPGSEMQDGLLAGIDRLLSSLAEARGLIRRGLPAVHRLARENFVGLVAAESPVVAQPHD